MLGGRDALYTCKDLGKIERVRKSGKGSDVFYADKSLLHKKDGAPNAKIAQVSGIGDTALLFKN